MSYPVGRSRFAALLLASIWLAAAATALAWAMQLDHPGWRMPAIAAALFGAGVFAAWGWWRGVRGELAWDGETWSCNAGPTAFTGSMTVALDVQRAMLVRWRESDRTRWLWLDSASRADLWGDLRRAVYSRARPEAARPERQPASRP
ncbi:MAG: hypothetical protein V4787_15260 [Pseudomonadota bacterium]